MKHGLTRFLILVPVVVIPAGCNRDSVTLSDRQVAVLNELSDEVNLIYGLQDDGWPRINDGPCGRFARDFREQWNSRFRHKVNIVFVMTANGLLCYHVMVKLPDGNYLDGGVSGSTVLKDYPAGTQLIEVEEFDPKRLDKWSYGLHRNYEGCPNYSDETTAGVIERHLAMLPANLPNS